MLDENNLTIIDIDQVPPRIFSSKYKTLFEQIPVGKAAVIPNIRSKYICMKFSLKQFQEEGEFQNIKIRKISDKIYIINNPAEAT